MTRPDLALWPCSTCGDPGVKNLGTRGHCSTHLADVFGLLSPDVLAMSGIVMQTGIMRPEFGPGIAECECCVCHATMVAPIGSPCAYCARMRERMVKWQAALTLCPPDIEAGDRRFHGAMLGWAERLARAVDAGLVTEQAADRAWKRVVVNVA